jgi:hypothetical protein
MRNLSIVVDYYKYRTPVAGKKDKGGRWYPSEEERCSCCNTIREPSRAFPWGLWKHCQTKKHVRNFVIEKKAKEENVKTALNMTPDEALEYIADEKENVVSYTAKAILRKLNKKEVLSYENDR